MRKEFIESHCTMDNLFLFFLVRTQPLDGSNCIMIGRLALVRTLSSMRSSNRFCVDACSIMDSGVVKTMLRAVEDDPPFCRCRDRYWVRRKVLAKRGEDAIADGDDIP